MTKKEPELNLRSYDAAGAALAQSAANAAQDQVDLVRNQNIIKTTAMGAAYAKWLANPVLKEAFAEIIDSSSIEEPKSPFNLAKEVFKEYLKAKSP